MHRIELTPGAQPPRDTTYKLSPTEFDELRKQLDELLAAGHIEQRKLPFGALVLFVGKKDGTIRMCVDYQALNKLTVKKNYPLSCCDALLERPKGATCFSKIDLRSGYHQVPEHFDDVEYTGFHTIYGHSQFRVMSFGLTNTQATFMHLMHTVLSIWSTFRSIARIQKTTRNICAKSWKL